MGEKDFNPAVKSVCDYPKPWIYGIGRDFVG